MTLATITPTGRLRTVDAETPFTVRNAVIVADSGEIVTAIAYGEVAENMHEFTGRLATVTLVDGKHGKVISEITYTSGNVKSTAKNPRFLTVNRDGLTRI